MAVTELALLHLRSDSSSTTNEALTEVQAAQAAYSGYPVTLLRQTEDPSFLYLLGGWESVARHNEWITSETNQKFLEQLKDDVEVEWMFHYDVNVGFIFDEAIIQSRLMLISHLGPVSH
jgi:quinol monooxygenase YgiN